jgi:hypothetical protein
MGSPRVIAAEAEVVVPAAPPAAEGGGNHLLEVGAGGEGLVPRPREERHPGRVVVAEARPGVDQRGVRLGVDGVHRLGRSMVMVTMWPVCS